MDTDSLGRRWARIRTQMTTRHELQTVTANAARRTRQISQTAAERSTRWAKQRRPHEWLPQVEIGVRPRSPAVARPTMGGGAAPTTAPAPQPHGESTPREREPITTARIDPAPWTRAESSTRTAESSTADIEMQVGLGKGGRKWDVPREVTRRPRGAAVRLLLRMIDIGVSLAGVGLLPRYLKSVDWDLTEIGLGRFYALPLLLSMGWEIAEIITLCARRGRGITPKAHIGVELTICIALIAMLGVVVWQYLYDKDYPFTWPSFEGSKRTQTAFVSLLSVTAATHFILFLCACVARHREIKGRRAQLMYIPDTGQIVYVVVKPRDSSEMPPVTSGKATPSRGRASQLASPQQSPPASPAPTPVRAPTHIPKPSDGDVAIDVLPPPSTGDEDDDAVGPLPTTPTMNIQRKPVPPKPVPVQSLHPPMRPGHEPPGPDYVPDETELERRARGDAQPQMISPHDLALKFSASTTGMTPAPSHKREAKVLVGGPRLQRSNSL